MKENKNLLEQIKYVAQKSPFYKKMFEEHRINTDDLMDFERIPFTTKDDLAHYNDDFLCVPANHIEEYVTTSGTLGNPVSFYLTQNDTNRLADNELNSMKLIGASKEDVFQLMVTMDKLFMAGLAYYLGIKKLGAGIVRTGPGSPQNQLEAILKFKSTVLIAIPSFILKLIDVATQKGIELNKTTVKSIVCIGEPIRNEDFSLNELGKRIQSRWNVALHSTYASTEMATAFTECKAGCGGHLNDALLHLEVLNDANEPAGNGELGEVVITPLGVEGMPLLRYRTGDLCRIYFDACSCGNPTQRVGPVVGRKQQMIKFKGTTIFPAVLHEVLANENINDYQIEVTKNDLGNDEIKVWLPKEIESETPIHQLKSSFKSKLRVTPTIDFMAHNDLIKRIHPIEKRKPQKIVFTK